MEISNRDAKMEAKVNSASPPPSSPPSSGDERKDPLLLYKFPFRCPMTG